MSVSNIALAREDSLAIVTIDRREARNALNRTTLIALRDTILALNADDAVGVIILTGAGEKAFVAGADIAALKDRSMLQTLYNENQSVLTEIAEIQKPVIAAVNGYALGGGCELALACDLRIASENAKFGFPELGLGFIPGAGGTQRLSRIVGIPKAKELIFTGDILDAWEAANIGLVSRVVPLGELLIAAKKMADKIIKNAPWAVKIAKLLIDRGADVDLHTGLLMERLGQSVLFGTEDRCEGVISFLEKRKPKYHGR